MTRKKPGRVNAKIIKAHEPVKPIQKAEVSTVVTAEEAFNAADWIEPPIDLLGYKALVSGSSILPQCVRAYKNNIAGFGLGIRYREDMEETPEMAAEFSRAEEILDLLNLEQDTKEVFEDIIEARETYGVAYLEVIRNLAGEVVQIDFIKEIPSIRKTRPLEPYMPVSFYYKGKEVTQKKKFRKYRQEIGGQTVYFKEFGDPRIMDWRNGNFLKETETLEIQYQANELLEFAIGPEAYGEVRWSGQVLGVDGSRKAEGLNNNYFRNGRHTPLMIMVEGGTLTDDSFTKLQEYMEDIKGENGQHSFIVLETESADGRADFDQETTPKIMVQNLASILQKDELFQDYLDNNRRRVQSAFLLPDIYVGYTTDFNRATAQTAMEVTEKQVFQPERLSIAWQINNKLLANYRFKYVEAYFKAPDITNPDDLYKMLTVTNNAGGLTPNKAKSILYKTLGETAEDYEGDWANMPLAYNKSQATGAIDMTALTAGLQKQIAKAEKNHDDAIVAVMKEVKSLLLKMGGDTDVSEM